MERMVPVASPRPLPQRVLRRPGRMVAGGRSLWWILVCVPLLLSCEGLGNPIPRRGDTEPMVWRGRFAQLVTRSSTVPANEAAELVAKIPRDRLLHLDRPEAAGAVTLVIVEPSFARGVRVPPTVEVTTEIELLSGRTEMRRWAVPVSGLPPGAAWIALFAVDMLPVRVMSKL